MHVHGGGGRAPALAPIRFLRVCFLMQIHALYACTTRSDDFYVVYRAGSSVGDLKGLHCGLQNTG